MNDKQGQTLIIYRNANPQGLPPAGTDVVTWDELKQRSFASLILKYEQAEVRTYRLADLTRPLFFALLLRVVSRGRTAFADDFGERSEIGLATLVRLVVEFVRDGLRQIGLIRQIRQTVERLEDASLPVSHNQRVQIERHLPALYLRTDVSFGNMAGGSITHIAGVLNSLDRFVATPMMVTTDTIPTVREDVDVRVVSFAKAFRNFPGLRTFYANNVITDYIRSHLSSQNWSFIYQRYSVNNYVGAQLASSLKLPFILEYNASEVWMGKNWGFYRLPFEDLSLRIEMLNLRHADLIVVVSKVLLEELQARGIPSEKILLNPNGVDIKRYAPDIDGTSVREKYGMSEKIVIGFIGTFGPWHGAEVLAEAFGLLLERYPELRASLRLLLIGDGPKMPEVKAALEEYACTSVCVLTGIIPQSDGPTHLAACDLLVSPHVQNPDGTRFFGSPTKLFEYMAMGRPIIASDLEQIGEILSHDETAWLVKPNDPLALAEGLKILLDDRERSARLAQAARDEVSTSYTWEQHTGRIIACLDQLMAQASLRQPPQ